MASAAPNSEAKPAPSASRKRKKKFPPSRAEELLKPSRLETLDPQVVMTLLPLRVYQSVADIGCGPGYFTIPLAKYAFDGKIHGVDVQQEMLDRLSDRTEEARLSNVELLKSTDSKIPLEDASVDGALIVNTLHEANNPKNVLAEARRILRKGGWASVVDWRREEMEVGPPIEDRLGRDDVVALAEEAGLRLISVYDLNAWEYIVSLAR
jgi:ubiquinone/menaquinone biosynthesis C-methylase UbiE